jgi:hypothetical protein
MKVSVLIPGGLVIAASLAAASGAVAQPQTPGQERALVGATWSGGDERGIAGYENYGGSFVRAPVAIGVHRSLSNPRDWIFVSKVEIGRDGDHARWRGVDTVRASGRTAESYVAYECKRASRGLTDPTPEPGVIGLVGAEYAVDNGDFGLLRAEAAWQVSADGGLTAIREPVVCADEGYGV